MVLDPADPHLQTFMDAQREVHARLHDLTLRLDRLIDLLERQAWHIMRPAETWDVPVSASKPIMIDTREFTHLYIYSQVALQLQIQAISGQSGQALANFAVAAGTWVPLPFQTGDVLLCPTIPSGSEVVVRIRGSNVGNA